MVACCSYCYSFLGPKAREREGARCWTTTGRFGKGPAADDDEEGGIERPVAGGGGQLGVERGKHLKKRRGGVEGKWV